MQNLYFLCFECDLKLESRLPFPQAMCSHSARLSAHPEEAALQIDTRHKSKRRNRYTTHAKYEEQSNNLVSDFSKVAQKVNRRFKE